MHQPAYDMLKERCMSVSAVARRYGLNIAHLHDCLRGRVVPSPDVRIALSQALDVPGHTLFDADMYSRQHKPRNRTHRRTP